MTRPDERTSWNAEDDQLDEEFSAESKLLREMVRDIPEVPPEVSGRIRRAARREREEPVEKSWIFATWPQLGVAATLLFAVSMTYLLVQPEYRAPGFDAPGELTKEELTPLHTLEEAGIKIERREPPMQSRAPEASKLEIVELKARAPVALEMAPPPTPTMDVDEPAVEAAATGAVEFRGAAVLVDEEELTPMPAVLDEVSAAPEEAPSAIASKQGAASLAAELYTPQSGAPVREQLMQEVVVSGARISAGEPSRTVAPPYPPRALEMGLAGWVEVQFEVSGDGEIVNARVADHCVFQPDSPDEVCSESPGDIFDEIVLRDIGRYAAEAAARGELEEGPEFRIQIDFELPEAYWDALDR